MDTRDGRVITDEDFKALEPKEKKHFEQIPNDLSLDSVAKLHRKMEPEQRRRICKNLTKHQAKELKKRRAKNKKARKARKANR